MRHTTRLLHVLFALLVLFSLATVSHAQEETAATITGTVTDANDAVVQGASVVVTNTATNATRTVQTNEDGNYVVTPLTPGDYTLVVELAGFKRYLQNVTLNARDRRPIDIKLETGSPSETVTVTDQAPLIQDSPTTQALVNNAQIVELPLNNRNFIRLLEAGIPGVSSDLSDDAGFGLTSLASVSINGMRRNAVNYFVDGVSNTDVGSNITLLSTPTVDAIKEFKVLSSNYTAEIGRSGGGAVTIVTRGGGNDFHGTLYDFTRNDRFNANNFFNNLRGNNPDGSPRSPVPKLRYHNFGGTFSGPVMLPIFGEGGKGYWSGRNKTFFFFSQETRRQTRGTPDASITVPSLAQRGAGGVFDFSFNLGPVICRTPTNTFTNTCTGANVPQFVTDTNGAVVQARNGMVFRPSDNRAYAGNLVPLADVDSRAIGLLSAWPLPNSPTNPNTFIASLVGVLNTRQETIRVDHIFNQNNSLFVRYTHDLSETLEPRGLFQGTAFQPTTAQSVTRVPGQVLAVSYTRVFSPAFVNEATFNYSMNLIGSQVTGRNQRSQYPGANAIAEIFPENNNNVIPSIAAGFTSIGSSQGYQIAYDNYVGRDNATWTKGNHTFKFGGEMSFEKKAENGSNVTQGSFGFSSVQTQGFFTGTPTPTAITGTGFAFASYLLGRANTYSEFENDVTLNLKFGRTEFFAQDTWKIRPNLTLDYGVRYQFFRQPIDENDVYATFDPALFNRNRVACTSFACTAFIIAQTDPLNGVAIAGRTSRFGRKLAPDDKNNFSPRLGLAWSPRFESGLGRFLFGGDNKSVFRLGYGFYYDQPLVGIFEQAAFTTPPFSLSSSLTSTTANVITFSNPSAGAPPGTQAPRAAAIAIANNFGTPEVQHWSIGLQREIVKNGVVDIAYVGTKGDHLIRRRNINFQQPADIIQPGIGTANAGRTRPFLGYGAITYIETSAKSRYHGLLSSFNYRFGNGFNISLAYTFSKNMTDSTNDRDAADDPQNPFNVRPEYAEARTSRPHIFSASYVYEIPFFSKSSNGVKRLLLGGFQISGITNFESGAPVPRVVVDTASGQRGNYPNLVSDPTGGLAGSIDPISGLPYIFDPLAFSVPALGTFGNTGRAFARLPGRNQTNLSLVKNLYFNSERTFYLQLRAESFNVFNHTQFTGVVGDGTTLPTSGNILTSLFAKPSSTRPAREFQFAAKIYF